MKSVNHHQLGKLIKESFKKKRPLFIWGGIGVGKSDSVRNVAKQIAKDKNLVYNEDISKINDKNNFSVIDIRASQMDISDIKGLPKFDEETKTTRWYYPNYLPKDKDSQGILFFDEINTSSPMVQNNLMSLILDRRVADYELPPFWVVMSAGNRIGDKGATFETPAPLNNRFLHIELEVSSVDDWISWAVKNKIDTRISTFLKFKPVLYKFDPKVNDKAFPSPRCIKSDSKILMADGSWKNISNIKIGEKVIGFENGSFVISIVLNKFENNSIKTKYEIDNGKNQIVCSGEHKFLTDVGYVKTMNLKRNIPIYMHELSILDERRGRISKTKFFKKNNKGNSKGYWKNKGKCSTKSEQNEFIKMEYYTKPLIDTDGMELLGRFNRWGRKFIFLQKKDKKQNLLRTSITNPQLFSFICGLVESQRISCPRRKKTKRMAKQICCKTLRLWNKKNVRIINTILADKKTADVINEGIYRRKNETKIRNETYRNAKIDRIKRGDKTFKLETKAKTISIRKGNNSETFYDLMTTSKNYIANGFITHNSWSFASEMISDKETRDLDTINILVASCVGEATAIEFIAWLKLSEKIDIEEILKNPLEAKLPREIDMTYAMISGILEHYKKDRKLMKPIVQLATRLTPEFAVMMLKLVKTHNTRFVEEVVNMPEWKKDLAKKLQPYFKDEVD
jgi:hypothetical protein